MRRHGRPEAWVYDAFPLEIHQHRNQPRVAQECPHCGEGPLFAGWSHLDRCSFCGLVFVRNPGDTWAFTIIGDRLPIGAIIVLIYFGVVRSHPVVGLTMMVVFVALLVWTAPNRWGVGIALHYLSRVYWPEAADPIPPPPATRPR